MAQAKTWVAFDVHVSGVVAATLDRDSGELRVRRLPGSSDEVAAFAAGLPGPVRATYEAGPTGFVLARKLQAVGVECVVCAPGLIPRGADAIASRPIAATPSGWCGCWWPASCIAVAVPSVEEEALRDLVRAREDLRGDLMRARHRLAKLLLRHEVRFDGPQANWTQAHLGWLAGVRLAQPASQRALEDYRGAVDALMVRREQLEAEIARALPGSPWAQTARRLMCLRGIDTLTAAGLCAEIGDFHRFGHPAQVMSYLGVVPVRAFLRRAPPPGPDHQVRQPARAPAARRGGLALPPPAASRGQPRAPPTRRRARGHRALLEGAAAAASRLGADGAAPQAPHDHRRRRRRELAGFCWAVATAD